ncbi:MAG TPA: ATP-binding protein [Salinivirga sp.]|uniref:sensor histidine kinase n=1 Tax=Salinivirga sp. TaxID=1970192 RepID=UPI002B47CB0D|nr:ATP-binding protein [Salinivirga sp.]HKK60512.1 ATP-binding protein [Salinivirga sp.]
MKILRQLFYFISGALILSVFSTLQKFLAGYEIHINGYYVPVIFGGIVGVILGNLFVYQLNQKKKLQSKNSDYLEAKKKAEENDRLKTAFLTNMSHEIRTPLNGIMGFTHILSSRNYSREQQLKYLKIISKSGDRLLSLINDIIDISKIEAGGYTIKKQSYNMNEQTNYLSNFFKPRCTKKGLTLILRNGLPDEKAIFHSDKEKVCAILINLIKNAIKFTDAGKIEFGYHDFSDHIEYFVEDTGIGIPAARQKAIFERFIQGDIEDKEVREGAGLGLSIAAHFTEMLNGKITVRSEPGKGSYFLVRLPKTS